MKKIGFDDKKYRELTKKEIHKRLKQFSNKLYLEIGGKLFDDFHASRVLPGFKYNSKIEILKELKDITEVIICKSRLWYNIWKRCYEVNRQHKKKQT